MKNRIMSLVLVLTFSLLLCGCFGGRELNTLGIAIAMGIDKADDGYMVTYQLLNPKALASQKPVNESPTILYRETGKDLFEIIRRFTSISPRKIYNSHLRMIVFGENFSKDGIQDIIDFFIRDHEFRTDFFFVVAKGTTASNILNIVTPLETVSGMGLYDSIKAAESSWAPVKPVQIMELVSTLISDGNNLALTGVELEEKAASHDSAESLLKSNASKIKLSGIAAFKNDRLVGWMDEKESKGYSYIVGGVKDTVGYIVIDEKECITFEVLQEKPKVTAYISKGRPAIEVKIYMKSNIAAETGGFDVSTEENTEKLNSLIEEKITDICNASIKKAKEELKTDIFGFGEEIHRTYPDYWSLIKDDWDKEFTSLEISVKVHSEINGLGQNTKSVFEKGSD